jgi:hypothetical protein
LLTQHQSALWEAYQLCEKHGSREEKSTSLTAFLNALLESPIECWRDWAIDIARQVIDDKRDIVIRLPLWRGALFPVLLEGFQAKRAGCARWLAGFAGKGYLRDDCSARLPADCQSSFGLLRAATAHDPTDLKAARQLVNDWADGFDYALHELPDGILFESHFASAEECLQLKAEFAEFVSLVNRLGLASQYGEIIAECEFHIDAFRDFRLHAQDGEGYWEYLQKLGRNPY